jgi:low affinity Fe/Cu permease
MKKSFSIWFDRFSAKVTKAVGSKWAFLFAIAFILGWACAGPYYHWSDSHSLFINTGTTIITFLMVFVIQQSSNKDTLAIHIKLDEILRAIKDADDNLRNVEEKTEEELNVIKRKS